MTDQTISQQNTLEQDAIQPIPPPEEMEIIREVEEDGTVVYRHPLGGDVEIYEDSPYEVYQLFLGRVSAVAGLMDNDTFGSYGFIFESLVQEGERQMEEMFKMINRTIGDIGVHVIRHNNCAYRSGRVVGVLLTPPETLEK